MARKYPMTVDEIVTSYRQARNRQTQIGVLADLNVCTRKEIRELLAEAGVLSPPAPETAKKGGRPISFDAELAHRLWAEGLTDAEIAEKLGIPVERFAKWRQRVGLLRPRVPPQCRQDTGENERPAEAGRTQEEQTMKKQSMDVRTPSAVEAGIVTVKMLRALLDAAEVGLRAALKELVQGQAQGGGELRQQGNVRQGLPPLPLADGLRRHPQGLRQLLLGQGTPLPPGADLLAHVFGHVFGPPSV